MAAGLLTAPCEASAQTPPALQAAGGAAWRQLSSAEQQVLQPLREQWDSIEAQRRQKWRDIAAIYPTLPAEQQARLRSRMTEWARMTPQQRNAARLHFGEVRQVPASERQARWQAWQQLPEDQRRSIGAQAGSLPPAPGPLPAAVRPASPPLSPQTKNNIVATPTLRPPQPVALGTVQAGSGASTRPINKSAPTPPRHQPVGLPKIAATPEFIDRTTLLPSRGPQGAAAAGHAPPVMTLPSGSAPPLPATAPPPAVASTSPTDPASPSPTASDGSH